MIYTFGDSFSNNPKGWPGIIGSRTVGSNGASEYRILQSYLRAKDRIGPDDKILFCHTHWSRVYLKDSVPSLSRKLVSHPLCDLVLKDVFEKQEHQFMHTLEAIWDEEFFQTIHGLMIQRMLEIPNSFHLTFFDQSNPKILNLHEVWRQHPGKINHMNDIGNSVVVERLAQDFNLC